MDDVSGIAQNAHPAPLDLVGEFVNTWEEPDPATDFLVSPDHLGRWLRSRHLLDEGERITTDAELARAVEVREALRSLMEANHDGEPPPAGALATLRVEAARVPLRLGFGADGTAVLEPDADGLDRALGRLLIAVFRAMHDGEWERMKVCRSDTCIAAFYDASRNRSGRFCGEGCRNVSKVRRYRARQRGDDA